MERKRILISLAILGLLYLFFQAAGYYIGLSGTSGAESAVVEKKNNRKGLGELMARNRNLKNRVEGISVSGVYIVVDTAKNRLYVRDGSRVIREAVISSGSGNILNDPEGKRKWVFDTPRGEFSVKSKYVAPAWTKPAWAFIEDGESVPRKLSDRVESGVLGDYALGFGNGYFIHGTLYTRLLGRNITHGCIRAGDNDLKAIYSIAGIGTRIFIF